MINPQPVEGSSSPYSYNGSVKTPPPSVVPPEQTLPIPKPPRHKGKLIRALGVIFTTIIIGSATFAAGMYYNFRSSVTVANEDGEGNARSTTVLNYEEGDDLANFSASTFKQFGDGRFNIVLLGVDKAAGLTDSIQVASIDTISKQANITSIPRDLYVTIPGHGRNKINAAYKFGEAERVGGGAAMIKQVVGNILGIRITHFALIDFSGLEKLVDAVGGIQVTVTDDIYDPYFPAETGDGYAPFNIKAGLQNLNGKTALRYARSRKTTSDFDRSRRQQQVIDAIRSKALSAGVISNPVKISSIVSALGKSFKTDLEIGAIRTLASIYQNIAPEHKSSNVLDTSTTLGLLSASNDATAGYISYPTLGYDQFQEIQDWYAQSIPDPLLSKEKPTLTLFGTSKTTSKQLAAYAEHLKAYGYEVTVVNTPQNATSTQVSYANSNKPFSRNYLEHLTSISAQSGNPYKVASDFSVVYVAKSTPTPSPKISPKVSPTTSSNTLSNEE